MVAGLMSLLLLPSRLSSQPDVLTFDEFEPYLHHQSDTLYVLNFWATWCTPCVKEIPALEKIREEYSNKNLRVILVSLDFPKQIESRLIPFLGQYSIHSEVIVLNDPDSNRWIEKVDPDWSGSIPATLIYHKDSREFYERSFTYDELKIVINSKINEL